MNRITGLDPLERAARAGPRRCGAPGAAGLAAAQGPQPRPHSRPLGEAAPPLAQVNQARRDQDRDHLRNRAEFIAGDNPRDRDSDDDGVMDGDENAGTIASFDAASGKLMINLFGGDTVSGLVTERDRDQVRGRAHDGTRAGDDRWRRGRASTTTAARTSPATTAATTPARCDSGPGDGRRRQRTANCTTADLVVGAVVEEAELRLEHGRRLRGDRAAAATFEQVELAGAQLLGVEPVLADADVDLERRVELVGGAHLAPHQLGRVVHLPRRALEEQLVVDLQDQAGLRPGLAQRAAGSAPSPP